MSPPRWARALLARLAEPDVRDEVIGDLEETHRKRAAGRGRLFASIVTSLEAFDMAIALWRRRRRRRGAGPADLSAARRQRTPPVSWLDFKLGVRMLVRYPGMTIVGGLAMALGIAFGATVFQVVTELIFPDHPYDDPSRVVGFLSVDTRTGDLRGPTLHDLGLWRDELATIDDVGARMWIDANLDIGDGRPEPIQGVAISASAFRLAPTPPVRGRPLLQEDEVAGATPVAVLSWDLWQSRFDGDDGVIGHVVRIGGQQTTVVGVMPPGFVLHVPSNDLIYVGAQKLWVPFRLDPAEHGVGADPPIDVFGQLAPGVTSSEAQAEVGNLDALLAAEAPQARAGRTTRIATFSNPFGGLDRGIGIRGAMAVMAFLIAAVIVTLCANVALLLFARVATRESEIVIRSALGASRARIVSQLLAEALGLAAVALGAGWLGASVGLGWVVDMVTTVGIAAGVSQPPIDATLAPRTMAYAAALALGGALVVGGLPGIKATGRTVGGSLGRLSGRGSIATLGRTWGAIIVFQVALTAILVPVAVFFGMATWEAMVIEPGFPAEEYVSIQLEMDREASPDGVPSLSDGDFLALYEDRLQELARRIRAEPGVTGVTAGDLPGFEHPHRTVELEARGPSGAPTVPAEAQVASVDPDFFEVIGLHLLSGRGFDSRDQVEGAETVIVNESFVRDRLGGGNAVGLRLRYPDRFGGEVSGGRVAGEEPWMEIVGVVSDVVMTVDPALGSWAGVYHARVPASSSRLRMAVHVPGAAADFTGQLRELALQTSPALRIGHPLTLDRAGSGALAVYGLFLKVMLVVGGFALLLTNAGIYAVSAFTVSRRTREIGLRVALGAMDRDIVLTTLSRMGRRVAVGVLLGSVPGLFLIWELTDRTVRPSAGTAGLALGYVAVMVATCMAACIVPTRRALRVQPTEALTAEG